MYDGIKFFPDGRVETFTEVKQKPIRKVINFNHGRTLGCLIEEVINPNRDRPIDFEDMPVVKTFDK